MEKFYESTVATAIHDGQPSEPVASGAADTETIMLTAMRAGRAPRSIMRTGSHELRNMSLGFDLKPPQAYQRLCEAFSSQGGDPTEFRPHGEMIRVLATSRPGGVFLCLGGGAGEMGAWVLGGMDLASRLVIVVHVQDAAAFLGDVRDHRFDLITDLSPGQAAELSRLALGRLAPGAFYMTRHSPAELTNMLSAQDAAAGNQESALDSNRFVLAHLPGELGVTLIARGPQTILAKRRGGRRARQGVTPLFSARSRSARD
jgi:hypothetical protein